MNNILYRVIVLSFLMLNQIQAMRKAGSGSEAFHSAMQSAPWNVKNKACHYGNDDAGEKAQLYAHINLSRAQDGATLWTIAFEQGQFKGTTVWRSFKGKEKQNEFAGNNTSNVTFAISLELNQETNRIQKLAESQKFDSEKALLHIDTKNTLKVIWIGH